jgi:hypothetical protein
LEQRRREALPDLWLWRVVAVAGRTQPNGRRPRLLHSSFIPPLALASTSSDADADLINPRCVEWRGVGLALLACDCDLRVSAGGVTAGASAVECVRMTAFAEVPRVSRWLLGCPVAMVCGLWRLGLLACALLEGLTFVEAKLLSHIECRERSVEEASYKMRGTP